MLFRSAPSSGDCTFTCTADDRCTLFVDGALVVKTTRNVYRETSGTLSLVGGRWYSAEVQFIEATGAAGLALYWQPAGFAEREIMRPGALEWPQWPEHAGSSAISRKLSLVEGSRYWLSLNCSDSAMPCGVGVRVHTDLAPTDFSLDKRRLQGRVRSTGECYSIKDRGQCCAALDRNNRPCVPATSQFSSNIFCRDYEYAVSRYDTSLLAACPATAGRTGITTTSNSWSAPGREVLPVGTSCNSIRDRAQCVMQN